MVTKARELLEGSRALSLVTHAIDVSAIDVSAARVGAGKFSLFSDLIEDRPTSVRGEILIKVIIIIKIRSCLRRKALRSLGREGKPDFGE